MSTIYDALEAPGFAYGTSSTASKSTSTLGISLLAKARAQQQQPPPPSLVYQPDMVTDLYREAKQGLSLEVGQLEADEGLSICAQYRRFKGTKQTHEHEDECSAATMDVTDFVEPAVAAARQILTRRGDDACLRFYSRNAKPSIETAIEAISRDKSRKCCIVTIQHLGNYLASRVLESLNLLASLANEGADLDYARVNEGAQFDYTSASITSFKESPALWPTLGADHPDESISQAQRPQPPHSETCRAKAISILAKAACDMLQYHAPFGIISCHEQWVFLKITASNKLAVSPVYSAPSTEPPLCGTLFALILQAVDNQPFPSPAELTGNDAKQDAEVPSSDSSSSGGRTQTPEQEHSNGHGPNSQGTHAGQAQVLLLTANVVSDSAPPLLYDPQSLLRTSAVLYRHIPRFTALSQTFPPTSEHHRHAVVPLKKIVAMGSSATVFSLHHSDLLVKVFGPEEGSGSRSHSGYWESAFHIEAEAYEAHLSAPALEDAVPRYHGSFLEPDHHTALIVLEDVGDPVCEGEDFGALAVSDRFIILGLLRRLAQSGIMTLGLAPRNVCRSDVDQKLRLIDFGKVTAVRNVNEQRIWLEDLGVNELMLPLEDVRRFIGS